MRKNISKILVLAMVGTILTGCDKKPESIVNDVYKSASEKKFENIAAYVLPDSIEPFSEEEAKSFAEYVANGFWQNDYSSFTIDSVVTNPENTEASFVVKTNFKNGLSYTETGTLRKTSNGNWRLMVDKEASDTTDVYSVSDMEKLTPELMRNLHYATVMTLAGRGLPQYQVMAARIIQDGILTSSDPERALDLLKSAADKNYVPAYWLLGNVYYKGDKKIPYDREKAFEWYLKAAEAGDVRAFCDLGVAYRDGDGTLKNSEKAKEWFEKGVAKENARCMRVLGRSYCPDIKDFENNNDKAYELISNAYSIAEKTKDQDIMRGAANNIGFCYYYGYGVPKDMNKAIEWFTKAAEAGDNTSIDNLGTIYYYGNNGIPKDFNKAFYWANKASKAGILRGKFLVAECYEYGRGVDMNKSKALNIYRELVNEHHYKDAESGYYRLL